jgi:hypothetical protein
MAVTNYLPQIAALDLLFSAYALGLGQIRPVIGLAPALACFAAQDSPQHAPARTLPAGPAEWLWRSLAHGRRQPLRLSPLLSTLSLLNTSRPGSKRRRAPHKSQIVLLRIGSYRQWGPGSSFESQWPSAHASQRARGLPPVRLQFLRMPGQFSHLGIAGTTAPDGEAAGQPLR